MNKRILMREARRIALTRLEEAARTEDDWHEVIRQWDHLDDNRERRERYSEIARPNALMLHWDKSNNTHGEIRRHFNVVIPQPIKYYWWRQLLAGDYLDTVFDSPDEMWQLVEDWDVASLLKQLTEKQKEVLYLRTVRLLKATQIANLQNKTDRAVRKLYAAAISDMRVKLAVKIGEQMRKECPSMTYDKRVFLEEYAKDALDKESSE